MGLGWSLRIDIANNFPGDAAAAVLGTTLGEPLFQGIKNGQNEKSGLWCQTPSRLNLVSIIEPFSSGHLDSPCLTFSTYRMEPTPTPSSGQVVLSFKTDDVCKAI